MGARVRIKRDEEFGRFVRARGAISVTHPNQPPAGGQNPNLRQQIHGPGRCDFSRPCFRVKKAQNEVEKVHATISKWEEAQRQRSRRHVSALLAVHLHAWRVIFSIYLACLGEAIACAESDEAHAGRTTPDGQLFGIATEKTKPVLTALPNCEAKAKAKGKSRATPREIDHMNIRLIPLGNSCAEIPPSSSHLPCLPLCEM